jgi:hypothetical protein
VTKPYTETTWAAIDALGAQVDAALDEADARLTMGGEPTFVSLDERQDDAWHYSALGADGRPVSDVQQNVLVANARRLLLQGWVAQANAYLAPFGLETRAYNWVEERRDDKGNKVGEVLRCALQFYAVPQLHAPLLGQEAAPAAAQGFFPAPAAVVPLQQQYGTATGAPKQV